MPLYGKTLQKPIGMTLDWIGVPVSWHNFFTFHGLLTLFPSQLHWCKITANKSHSFPPLQPSYFFISFISPFFQCTYSTHWCTSALHFCHWTWLDSRVLETWMYLSSLLTCWGWHCHNPSVFSFSLSGVHSCLFSWFLHLELLSPHHSAIFPLSLIQSNVIFSRQSPLLVDM